MPPRDTAVRAPGDGRRRRACGYGVFTVAVDVVVFVGVAVSDSTPVVLGDDGPTGTPGMISVEVEVDDEVVVEVSDDGDWFEQPLKPMAATEITAAIATGFNTMTGYPHGAATKHCPRTVPRVRGTVRAGIRGAR
jgi:hypothetical protein